MLKKTPNIAIYVDGKWICGFRSRDIFTIKTDKGEEITFQLVKTKGSALLNTLGNNKGVGKPFLKATDGTLTPYGEF